MKNVKRVLITGGNTEIPIDSVRVISNIFKGRTGVAIFNEFARKSHYNVTLLGNPGMKNFITEHYNGEGTENSFYPYKTYDQLYDLMKEHITTSNYDVIIHSAAVSDYYVNAVVKEPGGAVLDNSAKISSSHEKLYLELKQTRKIVDDIRNLWGFEGFLVKFKLQVGLSDNELLEIARASRVQSKANIIVANCLEWSKERAYISDEFQDKSVFRDLLPRELFNRIEELSK